MKDKKGELSILKQSKTVYPTSPDEAELQTFDNPYPGSQYTVEMETEEFTSLCPITSQPDFGTIAVSYIPDGKCLESKSFKLYLFSFRNYQGFAEKIVNRILEDLVKACGPKQAKVTGSFRPRGGITIKVEASYDKTEGRQEK